MSPFGLSPELQAKFEDFCKRYFASDEYKRSQQFLRNVVRKNTEKRYTSNVPQQPKE